MDQMRFIPICLRVLITCPYRHLPKHLRIVCEGRQLKRKHRLDTEIQLPLLIVLPESFRFRIVDSLLKR